METLQWSFVFPLPSALPIVFSNTLGLSLTKANHLQLNLQPAKHTGHHTLANTNLIRVSIDKNSFKAVRSTAGTGEGGEAAEEEAGEAAEEASEAAEEEASEAAEEEAGEAAEEEEEAGEAAVEEEEGDDDDEEEEEEGEANEAASESAAAEDDEDEASEAGDDTDSDDGDDGVEMLTDYVFDYSLDLGVAYGSFSLEPKYLYNPGLWFPLEKDDHNERSTMTLRPPRTSYRLTAVFVRDQESTLFLCGFEIWKTCVDGEPLPVWMRCLMDSLRFVGVVLMGPNVLLRGSSRVPSRSRFPKHRLMITKRPLSFPLQFGPEEQTSILPHSLSSDRLTYRASLYAQPVVFVTETDALDKESFWLRQFGRGSVLTSGWLDEILSPDHMSSLISWSTRPLHAAISTRHTERSGDMLMLLASYLQNKSRELALIARKTLNVTSRTPLLIRLPLHQLRNDPLSRLMLAAMPNRLFHCIVVYPVATNDAFKDIRFTSLSKSPGISSSLARLMGCPVTIADLVLSVSLVESSWVSPYKDPLRVLDENLTHFFALPECISGDDLLDQVASSLSLPPAGGPVRPALPSVPCLHDLFLAPALTRSQLVSGFPAAVGVGMYLCHELAMTKMPRQVKRIYDGVRGLVVLDDPAKYLSRRENLAAGRLSRLELKILRKEAHLQRRLDGVVVRGNVISTLVEGLQILTVRRSRLIEESRRLSKSQETWTQQGDDLCDSCHVETEEFAGCSSSCGHRLCGHCFVSILSRRTCPRCNVSMEKLLMSNAFLGTEESHHTELPSFETIVDVYGSAHGSARADEVVVVRNLLGRGKARVDGRTVWIPIGLNSMDISLDNSEWCMYHRTHKFLHNLSLIETALLNSQGRELLFANTALRDTLMLVSMLRPSLSSTRITYQVLENGSVSEEISRMVELGATVPFAGRYDSERTNDANNAFYNDRHHLLREILLFSRIRFGEHVM